MRKKLKLLPLTLALFLTVGCSSTGPKGDKGDNGAQGIQGEPGQDGHTPVITIGSNGNWYVDGVDTNIQAQGTKGDQGDTGTQGEKGDTGNGVLSIEKTNTTGNVDTYTITYTNGEETTFTVTNGTNGEQGIQGVPGQDGHTPVITIGSNGNWYIDGVDTNIRAQGEKGDQGDTGPQGEKGEEGNGILSIEKTSTTGNVDTYTITYTNGEKTTFTVTNGTNGAQGIQGEPGQDGHTPVITIGSNGNWYIDGVDTNIRAQGEKGDKGDTGAQGEAGLSAYEIYLKYYPEYTGTEKEWIDDLALGVLGEKYTIIWKNYDGTILEVDENVSRRAMVEYNGATPQRNNDDNYTFVGWTPKVEPATCNATYVASYESNTLPNWTIEMDSTNTSAKVVSYTGTEENVVVPTSYLGKPVTSIDTNAFKDNTSLKSVVIGNGVTSIGNHAFSGCSSLTSVVIPDSVTSIVEWAFAYCSSLTSIVIPNSVTSIGSFVFYDCSSLTIYCEASSQPSGWISTWNYANRPVYWSGEWSYVNEVPTPNK